MKRSDQIGLVALLILAVGLAGATSPWVAAAIVGGLLLIYSTFLASDEENP